MQSVSRAQQGTKKGIVWVGSPVVFLLENRAYVVTNVIKSKEENQRGIGLERRMREPFVWA
jgi:hypothetical protein